MIWAYIRRAGSMSLLQHVVVFLTTFAIPVSLELAQGWQQTSFCPSCVNMGKLVLYFGWYQIAMLVIASVTQQDRARWKEELNRVYAELAESNAEIRETHQRQLGGIQDRLGDLREQVRNIDRAMRDELGVDLPPARISLRGSAQVGEMTARANLTVISRGGRGARLIGWIKGRIHKLHRWAWRILVDWKGG